MLDLLNKKTSCSIGFMSNLSAAKGLDEFLALAATLENLPFEFHLAGPIADKKYTWIAEGNLPSNISWMGHLDESGKRDFFSKIDIFVFPTKYQNEAEPLVLYEAMSSGALVISYDVGCIRQMLTPPHVLAENYDDLVRAVKEIAGALPKREYIRDRYSEISRQQIEHFEPG
jgi:glycosyltransferase involved in cell wall biosynthesis